MIRIFHRSQRQRIRYEGARRSTGPGSLIAIALVCSALLTVCGERESGREEGDRIRTPGLPAIIFLGDSLTAGRGLSREEAFPARIERKLARTGFKYRVINAGRSGDTTAGGLARLSWYLRPRVRPALLVIGLGSNDAMRGLPVEHMEKNLREICRQTRRYDPSIKIFLFQMYTFPNMGKKYAGAYAAMFRRVARKEGIVLLPFLLQGVAGRPGLNQRDGVHPNTRGMEIVTDGVWRSLRPHL